jgi:hypothetical protein
MLEIAKQYASRGWRVFPIHGINLDGQCTCGRLSCPDAGKHPVTKNGLKDATTHLDKLIEYFSSSAHNIGIVTGKVSGITVIDIDVGQNKGGAESWSELIAEQGEPDTLMSKTGSGGMHVIFKYNSALRTGSNRLGKGIDVRNDGGYIVAPPSKHRSGGTYAWLNHSMPDDLPPHLLAAKKETRGRKKGVDHTKRKYSLEEVRVMLENIPSDDRDLWRNVGIILGREFARSDEAWSEYVVWSEKHGGQKGRNHDEIMREAFYEISQDKASGKELSMGSIVHLAIENGWAPKSGVVPIENFIYFAPGNNFVYRPTAGMWIKEAVDCAVGKVNHNGSIIPASDFLKSTMLATSMTKSPALTGDYIKGFDCREGELIAEAGSAVFNSYRWPTIEPGDAKQATPFLDHVQKVFNKPGDAEQFLDYMAHRVQKPEEKPRFALLIAGDQGVGKDTAVEFCMPAIGAWNVANVEPSILDSGFNEYAASTLVRVSEAANLHDMSKWAFNERMKVLIAGSPDHQTINPKYGQKYSVKMYCGVIVTTNHMLTGIYIPPDDRRYDVIEAASKIEMGLDEPEKVREYFSVLWHWFNHEGGAEHVAAFLQQRDISEFDASNGQRKTQAHQNIVSSSFAGDYWLIDALNSLGEPDLVRSDAIMAVLVAGGGSSKEYAPKMQPAMIRQGYHLVRNNSRKDGLHRFPERMTTVYSKTKDFVPPDEISKLKLAF